MSLFVELVRRDQECMDCQKFINWVFLYVLFFICAIMPSILWLKWLVEVLNPVLEFYSACCMKDSFTFSSIICRLPVCNESQYLVSFDVVSLFTNIPLDETISICIDFLYQGLSTIALPFHEEVFIELMGIPTKSVSFSFNEIMYHQIEGVSLGSPLDPILVNIFVGFQERHLFERFPKPFSYLRYVDDTFVSVRLRNDALLFFDILNELHSLRFTMEGENDNKLPFLDVLIDRCDSSLLTSVYRKPTFTGLYLSWHSFAPRSRKLNLIRCLSYRALNICCDCKIEDELKVFKDIFINNGYPEEVIDDNIKFTVTRLKNKNKTFGLPKCPVYFRLPWVDSASQSFAERIASSVYRYYHAVNLRPIFTTRMAFNSIHKDKLPIFKQSMLIYKFACRCSSTYVGRTCQRLEVRIRQHVLILSKDRQMSGYSQAMDSAISKHLLTINSYEDDCFSVLHKARDKIHLSVLEAIYISINRPSLCRQLNSQILNIFGGVLGDLNFSYFLTLSLQSNYLTLLFKYFSGD